MKNSSLTGLPYCLLCSACLKLYVQMKEKRSFETYATRTEIKRHDAMQTSELLEEWRKKNAQVASEVSGSRKRTFDELNRAEVATQLGPETNDEDNQGGNADACEPPAEGVNAAKAVHIECSDSQSISVGPDDDTQRVSNLSKEVSQGYRKESSSEENVGNDVEAFKQKAASLAKSVQSEPTSAINFPSVGKTHSDVAPKSGAEQDGKRASPKKARKAGTPASKQGSLMKDTVVHALVSHDISPTREKGVDAGSEKIDQANLLTGRMLKDPRFVLGYRIAKFFDGMLYFGSITDYLPPITDNDYLWQ